MGVIPLLIHQVEMVADLKVSKAIFAHEITPF